MSTAALSANLFSQGTSEFLQQRRADMQQLGQDLESGNLTAAQQDFSNIQSLAQSGPFSGDAFAVSTRQQDFTTIGQDLQSGDLTGAQQAFSQLESTFQHTQPAPVADNSSTSSATGPEIVLNLGNMTPGEQVTINIGAESNGTDQVTVGVSGQGSSSTPEQITFNLNPNSNQEIVLNLFNSSTTTTPSQSSGVSTIA
ncbi:MAG TPA: hypothetical protein VMX38_19745 [Verrucomicrobiae bacterium]|jgi:hypothetical protein|nr:hypothetical protein [Verrucomicrobiae bacterium]